MLHAPSVLPNMEREMNDCMTRREALLERLLLDLLELVPHSRDYQYVYADTRVAALRREADDLERRDALVTRARELTGFDPTVARTK